LGPGQIDGLLR